MGDCHFLEGNLRAMERIEHAKELLDEVGLGGERLEMYHIGASDAPIWVEKVNEMTERVRALGPNPLSIVRKAKPSLVFGEQNDSSETKAF